jgi:hypothetical protein
MISQVDAVFPVDGLSLQRVGRAAQKLAPGQAEAHRSPVQVVRFLHELGGIVLRAAQGHRATGDAAGIGVLVVQVDEQVVLVCGLYGRVHHLEE